MVLVIVVIVVLAFFGGLSQSFPMDMEKKRVFERGLSLRSVDKVYYSVSNKKEDEETNVVSQFQRVDLNKIKYSSIYDVNGESYLLVKTSKHRNKRYTSYLTLCPFKICTMGRKRTRARRYIRDNTTTT